MKGPGLGKKDLVLNSTTGNDTLVFNPTKTQLTVGISKPSLLRCRCHLGFGGNQESNWFRFAYEGSAT